MPATPILFCSHVVETGGAEVVLLDLLRELDRGRWSPHFAAPGEGPLVTAVRELGVPVHDLAIGGAEPWAKAASVPGAAFRLRALASRIGAQLVVATSMIAGYAAVLAQHRGLAALWHLHIVTRSRIARFFAKRARFVVAPSRVGLLHVGLADAPANRAEVIRNGVAERFFAAAPGELRTRLGVPASAPLLGIVGRLDPDKGHDLLLAAVAALSNHPPPHLVVAGGELFAASQPRLRGYAQHLQERITALGLRDRVHALGFVADTAPLLAALDAVVVPSRAPESAPRTIAEAQAAGCPVIASAIGGVPELVADGETGLLVPPDDAGALARALVRITTDRELRQRLAAGGRTFALQHHRLAEFTRRFGDAMERALATTA
ncbi:MAG: glycosyltransferase family 4 protein [Planctomycetota bacterium]